MDESNLTYHEKKINVYCLAILEYFFTFANNNS